MKKLSHEVILNVHVAVHSQVDHSLCCSHLYYYILSACFVCTEKSLSHSFVGWVTLCLLHINIPITHEIMQLTLKSCRGPHRWLRTLGHHCYQFHRFHYHWPKYFDPGHQKPYQWRIVLLQRSQVISGL